MTNETLFDFLVIGGGIVGLTIARELQNRMPPTTRILVVEKEPELGRHASGRNSGVIHAGFYYSADTLKAALTRKGNALLTAYCEEHKIALNKCGKLVVAKNEQELARFDELLHRARLNNVTLVEVDEKQMREIEPRARSFCGRALFSPTTSSVNPLEVLDSIREEFIGSGGRILTATRYLGRRGKLVKTSRGLFEAKHVINAAGLYADKVARDFGFSHQYAIIPFKGLYLYSSEPKNSYRTNIYPVPDLKNPFLGVHFTLQADGSAKIGPTALPALWREQYKGLENFNAWEFATIALQNLDLLSSAGFEFAQLARDELAKASRHKLIALASELVTNLDKKHFTTWGKPGIRAQLLNLKSKTLEMDFIVEGDGSSTHVLNAVSPAFTCCLSFAQAVCERLMASVS